MSDHPTHIGPVVAESLYLETCGIVRMLQGELDEARKDRTVALDAFHRMRVNRDEVASLCVQERERADLAERERDLVRSALATIGNSVGAKLNDTCSPEFLALVADEVRLVFARLTRERNAERERANEWLTLLHDLRNVAHRGLTGDATSADIEHVIACVDAALVRS